MVKVGDHIALASNAATRSGVVVALSGSLIRVRWESGAETNVIPGPGTLSVVPSAKKQAAAKKPKAKAAKKSAPAKKAKPPSKAKGKKAR
ncbi:MAG: hypothetical protein ABJD24_02040 [Acidimicrobiales bacterium]